MPPNDSRATPPARVLVIEDSELDRLWLRHKLPDGAIEVVEAADGLLGLEICGADPPDLILLDLGLPFCDGFEVLRRLKADRRTAEPPVIVVSATSDPSEKARALDLGAVDFVTKPYDVTELRARIRSALRTGRARIDAVTGLATRAAFEERLATEWALHRRHGEPLSVLIAQLAEARDSGPERLRRVSAAVAAAVRATDLSARYGGGTFAVVAPRCDTAGALITAERFLRRLAAHPDRVTVGVASVPESAAASAEDLLARAAAACQRQDRLIRS